MTFGVPGGGTRMIKRGTVPGKPRRLVIPNGSFTRNKGNFIFKNIYFSFQREMALDYSDFEKMLIRGQIGQYINW